MSWLLAECGISHEQFWRLTPGKVSALVQARKERIKREDYRAGIITATIRAALGSKNAKVFDDFPEYHVETPQPEGNNLRGYFRALMESQKQKTPKTSRI